MSGKLKYAISLIILIALAYFFGRTLGLISLGCGCAAGFALARIQYHRRKRHDDAQNDSDMHEDK